MGHRPETDISPIWNPEFFGNMIMVNGNTWPYQIVQQRRYRFRFLNGCNSRFLILDFSLIPGVEVWQIGNEGGFLAAPVNLTAAENRLLMSPAERADVIVDFTHVPLGNYILGNLGPDEPFGGGVPGIDFAVADPATTGQILQLRVEPAAAADPTTPPQYLVLPPLTPLPEATFTRRLALIEESSRFVPDAPVEAELGTVDWDGEVLENEKQVRIDPDSIPTPAEPGETGFKDTVIAYPGQVTRVRAQFSTPGQFVWHCHIVEHEDNEMMRPYRIGPVQPGQPS